MKRVPEPELMDAPAQVNAYAEADFSEPNQLFVDQLLSLKAVQNILDSPQQLIDLGCGPGDICLRLAKALPEWKIVGIDAGENMLKTARAAALQQGLTKQVDFRHSYLPDPELPEKHYPLVISNSLLHHLPDPSSLWLTIKHIAKPGAWVQVMDLERPDSDARAHALVKQYAHDAPKVLQEDFFNSLKAAWTVDEVQRQIQDAELTLEVKRISDRHWVASGLILD